MSALGKMFDNAGDFCKKSYKTAGLAAMMAMGFATSSKAQFVVENNSLMTFGMGYEHKANSLYAPAGFYWEGMTPDVIIPGLHARMGYSLHKEGFHYEASGYGNVSGTVTDTEAYLDLKYGPTVSTKNEMLAGRIYGAAGVLFSPGARENTNINAVAGRAAAGVDLFIGKPNPSDVNIRLFLNAELLNEFRTGNDTFGIAPQAQNYKKGFNFGVRAGLVIAIN